jgi:CDP-glucose 4,6-dehydratase
MPDGEFWRGRRVLVTGHTGFKGAWLTMWLKLMGAEVVGFSSGAPTEPSLYELARVEEGIRSMLGNVRDGGPVHEAVADSGAEIVFHLAAQSLVRRGFEDPVGTYAVNVLGTARLLDAVRGSHGVRAVVCVTSDKCYANDGRSEGYREDDPLGGRDPYSSSKAAQEHVCAAYRETFDVPVATARAGNVIGGGDWSADRLVPDLFRAALNGRPLVVRNPHAIRPWQHVLNPLSGYLQLAERLWKDSDEYARPWNFGPADEDARPVHWMVDRLAERWPEQLRIEMCGQADPREAAQLRVDSTQARERLGWEPTWDLTTGLDATVGWYLAHRSGEDSGAMTSNQIERFARGAVQPA